MELRNQLEKGSHINSAIPGAIAKRSVVGVSHGVLEGCLAGTVKLGQAEEGISARSIVLNLLGLGLGVNIAPLAFMPSQRNHTKQRHTTRKAKEVMSETEMQNLIVGKQ